MKRYIAKCPQESIKEAAEWCNDKLFDSKRDAHKSGKEGIKNGMGNSYLLVEVTFKVLPKKYKVRG